eukprot:Phypoly_transcript_03418.p1 GENE.Phypoly_transcript_03418~~Phypoly_transcript_03418.p1  ORF type:complete len:724 (+),score=75.11 Phypoly_transcript_03418:129-2300(+)
MISASHQGHVERALQAAFPSYHIQANAREQVRNPETGSFLELDMWIPDLQFGIEFQDSHHYVSAWYAHDSLESIQSRDSRKAALIRQSGIDLVLVPYWWDSSPESLMSTIQFETPWIYSNAARDPIPLNPPTMDMQRPHFVPKVGELMLATFVESTDNVFLQYPGIKWWVGEKYDGIRCVWSPLEKVLYSRNGIQLCLPTTHRSTLGPIRSYLDGEIWCGRGMYHETHVAVVPTQNSAWYYLRLVAFDNPMPMPANLPFEKRYRVLCREISVVHPLAILAFRTACKNQRHLEKMLKDVLEKGGEGCVLRKMGSGYERGRSSEVLKVKSSQDDTEALVIGARANNRILKLPSGRTFEASLPPNAEINPKMGDVVTFEHEIAARREIPTNPKISRIRKDLVWNDVLRDYATRKKSSAKTVFSEKPRKFWKIGNSRNTRMFFENFAKKRGLDPRRRATWYSLSRGDFKGTLGASLLHGIGYVRLVQKIFPELSLDPRKFQHTEMHFWQELGNRKEFFDKVARDKGFDPLVAENWYSITRKMIEQKKGNPLAAYSGKSGKLASALIHLYPNIGLDKNKFPRPKGYWKELTNRKLFFDKYATEHSFDPLVAANWYQVRGEHLEREGAQALLKYSKGGFVNELLKVYPNIGLDAHLFSSLPANYWENENNRRRVLSDFASKNKFDPRNAQNWQSISFAQLFKEKHAKSMMRYYQNNISIALQDLYPSIG